MKLIGSILLSIWLIMVGFDEAGYVAINHKFLALFAIVTGVVILLEALNAIKQ